MIKKIFNGAKWLWSLFKSRNRNIDKFVYKFAKIVTDYTKNEADDKSLEWIAMVLDGSMIGRSEKDKKKIVDVINKTNSGPLKKLKINYDKKDGIKLGWGIFGIKYNPEDGSIVPGISL